MTQNITLYPWFRFLRSLLFWQAVWFLYIQTELSAAEAILIYAVFDIATTVLEVPSGWMSDRWGRRPTLLLSALAGIAASGMQAFGGDFWWFFAAQVFLGAHMAFASGTDSSLLYESLASEGRETEMERQELIGWRAGFVGFALSALSGGLLARFDLTWPYWASTVAFIALLILTVSFREPPRRPGPRPSATEALGLLMRAFRSPVLLWLFAISVLMYGFSHVPFVFGQPFIEQALADSQLSDEAPIVSGAITAAMMTVSLLVSLFAPKLRYHIGLLTMLLAAFAMQVALPGALAIAAGPFAILLLLGRMVPDAFAQPFIVARMQSELSDAARATFLSIKSLLGRLFFAVSLWVAAASTTDIGRMTETDVRLVLGAYAAAGLAALALLLLSALRLRRSG